MIMDEILAVIIFGMYSSFVLNINFEKGFKIKSNILCYFILSTLYIGAGYFCIVGLTNMDIKYIIFGNILLWSMKLIRL